CAQRGANRQFTAAPGVAREQEVDDVDAGDGQNENDGSHDGQERGLDRVGNVVLERVDDKAALERGPARAGKFRPRGAGDLSQLLHGLAAADARLEPAGKAKMIAPLPAVERGGKISRVVLLGGPDV